jgi:hypothetical protein
MTLIGGFALIAAACSVSTDDQPTISSASPPADVPATSVVESPGSDTTIESPTPPTTPSVTTPPTSTASQPSIESTNGVPKDTSMFGPVECRDGEENNELSHLIYEPDLFDVLVPMGRAWDSHVTPTDHLYVFLYEERERKMVKTPAAGRIINIESFSRTQSPFWDSSIKEPDLRVIIAHSCTLFSVFIHVGELVPKVAAVVGEIEPGGRWHAGSDTIIELNAGDPFAVLGGSSFDYSLHDETKSLTGFQIPEHYEGEAWKIHTVDPFDYMTDEIVSILLAKNVRQVEPYGGKIDYDVVGTLAGNWFIDGTVGYAGGGLDQVNYWDGHLSIHYDHVDPSKIRISIGQDTGLTQDDYRVCGAVYAVMNNSPDPATITVDDEIVKYELTGRMKPDQDNREHSVSDGVLLGTFMLQVIDNETIRTEFFLRQNADSVSGWAGDSVLYRR